MIIHQRNIAVIALVISLLLITLDFYYSEKTNQKDYEIKLDKIYLENALNQKELDEDKLFFIQERINEIFSQSSLNNILKYSNLRKIIQSFFN